MNFEQYQNTMNSQMSQNSSKADVSSAASDMSRAAQNLNMSASNSSQQTQSLVQSVQATQAQIMNLSNQVQMLVNQMRSSSLGVASPPPVAMPMPPPVISHPSAPMGPGASAAIGQMGSGAAAVVAGAGSFVGGHAVGMGRSVSAGYNSLQHTNFGLGIGAQPGALHMSGGGVLSSMFQNSGLNWDPSSAQNYTFGAYQRAQAGQAGIASGNWVQGGANFGLGMLSASNLANIGVGALGGPLGMLASFTGVPGMMAAPLDAVNPAAFAQREIGRATMFEGASGHNAHSYLRGRAGQQPGSWDLSEQAKIGSNMQRMTLRDLTFDSNDITEIQMGMADSGQMRGVQTVEDYSKRVKEGIELAKKGMKVLQATNEEVMGFMGSMHNEMGIAHNKMGGMITRAYAGAHLAGLSPSEMMEVGLSGARGAGQFGLMAATGARNAMGAYGLAGGVSHMGGMDANLLASVGGEGGLAQLLLQSQNQFMSGAGGTMMIGGGMYGTNVHQGLTNLGGGIRNRNDLLGLVTDRHRKLDDLSPEDTQAQMAAHVYGLAQQFGPQSGEELRRMMQMIAMNQHGMSSAEAEAFVESMGGMHDANKRRQDLSAQAGSDYVLDRAGERRSVRGRIRLGVRGAMGEGLGINDGVEGFQRFKGITQDSTRNISQAIGDKWHGVDRGRFDDHVKFTGFGDDIGFNDNDMGVARSEFSDRSSIFGKSVNADISRSLRRQIVNTSSAENVNLFGGESSLHENLDLRRMATAIDQNINVRSMRDLRKIDPTMDRITDEQLTAINRDIAKGDNNLLRKSIHGVIKDDGRSDDELASELRDEYKMGGWFSKSFRDHELLDIATNPLFQELSDALRDLIGAYDPGKIDNKELDSIKSKIITIMGKAKEGDVDATLVRAMEQMLSNAGVSVSGGNVDITRLAKKHRAASTQTLSGSDLVERDKLMRGGHSLEEATRKITMSRHFGGEWVNRKNEKLIGDVGKNRSNERGRRSVVRSLMDLGSSGDGVFDEAGNRNRGQIIAALEGIGEENLQSLAKSDDALERIIGSAGLQGSNASDNMIKMAVDALGMMDIEKIAKDDVSVKNMSTLFEEGEWQEAMKEQGQINKELKEVLILLKKDLEKRQ